MLGDKPRAVALFGCRLDHLAFLDEEAKRLNVPRSRLLEALLDFAIECLRGGRLVLPSGEDLDRDAHSRPRSTRSRAATAVGTVSPSRMQARDVKAHAPPALMAGKG